MSTGLEIKQCKECSRDYMNDPSYAEYEEFCPICVETGRVTTSTSTAFDDIDYEMQKWAEQERKRKEAFMRQMVRKHMLPWHRPLFWLYEKLADFFVPRVEIVHQQQGGTGHGTGYQQGYYGIKIYGQLYLMPEKEVDDKHLQ